MTRDNNAAPSISQPGSLNETASEPQIKNTLYPIENQSGSDVGGVESRNPQNIDYGTGIEDKPTQVPSLAEGFLTLLDEQAEKFLICAFHETEKHRLSHIFYDAHKNVTDELVELNNKGYGIFITVNKTVGDRRSKAAIVGVRAIWRDQDTPVCPELPMQPHITVETSPGKFHHYILVEGAILDEFEEVQLRMVEDYGSDPNAKDRSRTLRLPGYLHRKNPKQPHLVTVTDQSNAVPMDWSKVKELFPPVRKTPKQVDVEPPAVDVEELKDAMDSLDPDMDYGGWLEIGMALHNTFDGTHKGLELWIDWSKQSVNNKFVPGECEAKWTSFKGEGVTGATLFKMAKDSGWNRRNPSNDNDEEGQSNSGGGNQKSEKKSLAAEIVDLVSQRAEIVHDVDELVYAIVDHGSHKETLAIHSTQFIKWASREMYETIKRVPNANAFSDAVQTLEGYGLYEGRRVDVYVRVATLAGEYFVDLCTDDWTVVEITAKGWRLIKNGEKVYFRRSSTMRSLPLPQECGFKELHSLLKFHFNMTAKEIWLLVGFILSAYMPDTEYPILEIVGSPGSGKSTAQEMVRCCIDPNKVNLRAAPSKVEDIFVSARNNHVVSYNNMSVISAGASDAFCSLSTGGGYASRTLYSNVDETVSDVQKPVIMNGISALAKKPDLIDRLIKITLQPISSSENKAKKQVFDAFRRDLPKILGALLDLLSKVVERLPHVELSKMPRMAEFAILCETISQVISRDADILDFYYENRSDSLYSALETSPCVMALISFMAHKNDWEGTVQALWLALSGLKNDGDAWVKSARGLGELLRLHSSALKAVGIELTFDPVRKNDGYHLKVKRSSGKRSRYSQPTQQGLPIKDKIRARECSEGGEHQETIPSHRDPTAATD